MTAYVLIKAVLELTAPGGVAAPEQLNTPEGIDLPLARTPGGEVYVPATSLAGSLRAHLGERAPTLMGEARDGADPVASHLWFLGADVAIAGSPIVRSRTAIDRRRGSAAINTLHTSERMPPGSRITSYLRLNDPTLSTELFDALTSWAPMIGGGRSTGNGHARIVSIRHRTIDLDTPDGRRAWLTGGGRDMFADDLTDELPHVTQPSPQPVINLDWEILDGLHIGTGIARRDTPDDRAEVARIARDHLDRPYVPGTAWKGVLRSRCEYILRSLGIPACPPSTDDDRERACGTCRICHAFGYTHGDADTAGRRGQLTFHDSPIDDPVIAQRTHVSLDRVFGGARGQGLYTEEIVESGRVTLTIHADSPPDPVLLAVLTLACHDLHHGLIGIGGSTTRGIGTLRLTNEHGDLAAARDDASTVVKSALAEMTNVEEGAG